MTKKGKGRKAAAAAAKKGRDAMRGGGNTNSAGISSAAQKESTEEENKCARRHPPSKNENVGWGARGKTASQMERGTESEGSTDERPLLRLKCQYNISFQLYSVVHISGAGGARIPRKIIQKWGNSRQTELVGGLYSSTSGTRNLHH